MSTKTINKSRIGDAFVLMQKQDVLTNTNHYIHLIRNYLKSRVPNLFTKVHIIYVTSEKLGKRPDIIKRINRQLSVPLRFFHVIAEGGDLPNPFFGIAPYCWYSSSPGNQGHGRGDTGRPTIGTQDYNFDLSSIMSNIGYGVDNDPPLLVWIDSCRSCGSDLAGNIPTDNYGNPTPDYSFASTFGIQQSGIGVYLGWGGTAIQYGAFKPPTSWTTWRENLYNFLFAGGNNFQTAINRANSITIRDMQFGSNAQDRAFWTGDGTTGF